MPSISIPMQRKLHLLLGVWDRIRLWGNICRWMRLNFIKTLAEHGKRLSINTVAESSINYSQIILVSLLEEQLLRFNSCTECLKQFVEQCLLSQKTLIGISLLTCSINPQVWHLQNTKLNSSSWNICCILSNLSPSLAHLLSQMWQQLNSTVLILRRSPSCLVLRLQTTYNIESHSILQEVFRRSGFDACFGTQTNTNLWTMGHVASSSFGNRYLAVIVTDLTKWTQQSVYVDAKKWRVQLLLFILK